MNNALKVYAKKLSKLISNIRNEIQHDCIYFKKSCILLVGSVQLAEVINHINKQTEKIPYFIHIEMINHNCQAIFQTKPKCLGNNANRPTELAGPRARLFNDSRNAELSYGYVLILPNLVEIRSYHNFDNFATISINLCYIVLFTEIFNPNHQQYLISQF